MNTLEIDISNNKKEAIERLFIGHEVYADSIREEGDKFGYLRNDTTGASTVFYFIQGQRVERGIKNLATGEIIELA